MIKLVRSLVLFRLVCFSVRLLIGPFLRSYSKRYSALEALIMHTFTVSKTPCPVELFDLPTGFVASRLNPRWHSLSRYALALASFSTKVDPNLVHAS